MPGKNSRSKNAVKHGAYSQEVLLPHESRRDYIQLVADARSEWNPVGPTEELLVGRLVDLIWRQMRVKRFEDARLQQRIDDVQGHNRAVPMRAELQAMAPEFAQADSPAKVEKLLNKYGRYRSLIVAWMPRPTESEKESGWGSAIAEHLKNLKVGEMLEGSSEVTALVDPLSIEVQEDRMGRLDERVSQLTKRLVQTKVSKQMFGARNDLAKVVSSKSLGATRPGTIVEHERSAEAQNAAAKTSDQKWMMMGPIDYERAQISDADNQNTCDGEEQESSKANSAIPTES